MMSHIARLQTSDLKKLYNKDMEIRQRFRDVMILMKLVVFLGRFAVKEKSPLFMVVL